MYLKVLFCYLNAIFLMLTIHTVTSQELEYKKTGQGTPLVLLHGFPSDSSVWDTISASLSTHHTLIMPDLPACTSINQMAEAVKCILDEEQLQQVVIAGHSMGGYVALAIAHLFPDRVKGLSLMHSTPLADDEPKQLMRKKAIEIIRNGGKKAFLKQMILGLFADDFKLAMPDRVELQINLALTFREDSLINFYTAMMERQDRTDVLSASTFPVQWIVGAEDTVIPLQKVLPFCHRSDINFISFYPHIAHMAMYEAPEQLKNDLHTFTDYCYRNT